MRRVKSSALWCAFALVAASASSLAYAADEPREWLARMNEALMTRNYDGVFFHVRGGRVETMRIIHRVQAGQVTERLVSLDGSGREFVRTGGELICYLPDKRTVLVERRPAESTLLGSLPKFDDSTADFYDVKHVEKARLMGRDTRVIAVLPRDEFRYGYRLWIDESTTMPLKTQLCDAQGRVIEQVQFANLSLPERIADTEFKPAVSTAGFRWVRQDPQHVAATSSTLWRAMQLPPGFRMTLRSAQVLPGSPRPVEHLVFSDGIASVSVFVEGRSVSPPPVSGPAKVGSSSAFSTTVDGHQVTAVGEVPPETVRVIANSLQAEGAPALAAPGVEPRSRSGVTPPPGLSFGSSPPRQ